MIEQDHQRFRQIVKGRIRNDLRKFISRGELIGKEGKHLISIPVHGIEIPTFRYGDNSTGMDSAPSEDDIVKQCLIKYFGYNEASATDVLNYVAASSPVATSKEINE